MSEEVIVPEEFKPSFHAPGSAEAQIANNLSTPVTELPVANAESTPEAVVDSSVDESTMSHADLMRMRREAGMPNRQTDLADVLPVVAQPLVPLPERPPTEDDTIRFNKITTIKGN